MNKEESIDIGSYKAKEKYNFEEIYDEYFTRVYKFLSYRINNEDDVKDLTAEVFKKIFSKLSSYDKEKSNLDVWIFAIARNTLYDYYRKINRRQILPLEKIKDMFSSDKDLHEEVEKAEEITYLKKAIEKLNEREKQIISYKFGAELNNKDIAELMNLSQSNVSVIVYRTIKKLRKEMEEYYEFKWKI